MSLNLCFMFQYITEKFWSRLKMNVIPIVLGQARYFMINNKSESRRYFFNLAGQLLNHRATTLIHQCTGIPRTGKDSSVKMNCYQNAAKTPIISTSTWYLGKTANKSGKIQIWMMNFTTERSGCTPEADHGQWDSVPILLLVDGFLQGLEFPTA